jgi:rSAM/selenodomain-associated transferase 2/rSAM/selenodomain-associated transferase 1
MKNIHYLLKSHKSSQTDKKIADNRLIIFGRYPVVGRTKTRLIPALGPAGAAQLQRILSEQVLQTALSAAWTAPFELEFCYTGGSYDKVCRWLCSDEIHLTVQSPGNLGQRMYKAMTDAFDKGHKQVVLAGTDVPGLSGDHLVAAFNALNHHDLVFGPSTDGGYWLVGSRRKLNVFDGISWSKADVLKNTLKLAKASGWSAHCLEPLTDMDTLSDLEKWQPGRKWHRPYLSVIIPVLNEETYLRKTIAAARTEDTEVIVVDGGSKDASVNLAKEAGSRVLYSPKGRAVQLNAGARSAKGQVFLFLHADTILPKGFVSHIFDTLMDAKLSVGAFGFKTDYDKFAMRIIEKATNLRSRIFQLPYGDQALFMSRDTFVSLGGFPEVPIAEDLFLVRNAVNLGKVKTLKIPSITSGRSWRRGGVLRTTIINYLVAAGCFLRKSPHDLARLYNRWTRSSIK